MDNNLRQAHPAFIHADHQQRLQVLYQHQQRQHQLALAHANASTTSAAHPQPPTATINPLPTIITALPRAFENLQNDFSARFNRLEALFSQFVRGASLPAPSLAHDANYAALSATLGSIREKLSKIENDFADVQSVDALRASPENASVNALTSRLGRVEAFVEATGVTITDEVKDVKSRVSNIERLLLELLAKTSYPHAEAVSIVRHEIGVMTDSVAEETSCSETRQTLDHIGLRPPALQHLPATVMSSSAEPAQERILHDANVGTDPSAPPTTFVFRTVGDRTTAYAYTDASTCTEPTLSSGQDSSPAEFVSPMGSLTQIMHMSPNVNRLISLPPLDLTSIFQLSHGHIEDAELSNGVPVGERQSEEDLFERYMNFETYRDKGKGKVYARVLGTNSLGLSKTGGSTLLPARWSIDSEESRESTTGIADSCSFRKDLKRKRNESSASSSCTTQEITKRRASVSSMTQSSLTSPNSSPGPTANDLRSLWDGPRTVFDAPQASYPHRRSLPSPVTCAPTPSPTPTPLQSPFVVQMRGLPAQQAAIALPIPQEQTPKHTGMLNPSRPISPVRPTSSPRRPPWDPISGPMPDLYTPLSSQPVTTAVTVITSPTPTPEELGLRFTSSEDSLTQGGEKEREYMMERQQVMMSPPRDAMLQERELSVPLGEIIRKESGTEDQLSAPLTNPPSHVDEREESVPLRDVVQKAGLSSVLSPIPPHSQLKRSSAGVGDVQNQLGQDAGEHSDIAQREVDELRRQLEEELFRDDGTQSGKETMNIGDAEKRETGDLLTEENVHQLTDEHTMEMGLPRAPSVALSESALSSLMSMSSSSSSSNETVRPDHGLDGFGEMRSTFSIPSSSNVSSTEISKRKRTQSAHEMNRTTKGMIRHESYVGIGKAVSNPLKKRRKTDDVPSGHVLASASASSSLFTSISGSASMSASSSGAQKRKVGRPKKKLTYTKNCKVKKRLQPINAPPVSRYWEVISGYNGECDWPVIVEEGKEITNFIQCSCCEAWYHFGCLAVLADDPRTQEDVDLFCPPCEISFKKHGIGRKLRNVVAQHCARPDCSLHALSASADLETYFVERIIGRIPHERADSENPDDETKPIVREKKMAFLWLLKWLDYDAKESTWEPSGSLPPNGNKYIQEFECAAMGEGFDVGDPMQYIVLEEGAKAGWRKPGWECPVPA